MSFHSRLDLVTHLLARIDVVQAGLRITFRVTGIVRYLIGGENAGYATEENYVLVDFPMPTIIQNGVIKLVVTLNAYFAGFVELRYKLFETAPVRHHVRNAHGRILP
jgi:hypothetical protein